MSDEPKFTVSSRVREWAASRRGPEYRPAGGPPPCVGCGDKDRVDESTDAAAPEDEA